MSEPVQPRVERGIRRATKDKPFAIFYRVINGPRGMLDGWRTLAGHLLTRPSASIEAVSSLTPSMLAHLSPVDQLAVSSDTMLINRAAAIVGSPTPASRPMSDPQRQKIIDDARRYDRFVDRLTSRRRCRIPVHG